MTVARGRRVVTNFQCHALAPAFASESDGHCQQCWKVVVIVPVTPALRMTNWIAATHRDRGRKRTRTYLRGHC